MIPWSGPDETATTRGAIAVDDVGVGAELCLKGVLDGGRIVFTVDRKPEMAPGGRGNIL